MSKIDDKYIFVLWFLGLFMFGFLVITVAQPVAIALVLGFCAVVIHGRLKAQLGSSRLALGLLVTFVALIGYLITVNVQTLAQAMVGLVSDVDSTVRMFVALLNEKMPGKLEALKGYGLESLSMLDGGAVAGMSLGYVNYLFGGLVMLFLVPILLIMFFFEHDSFLPTIHSLVPKGQYRIKTVISEWLVQLDEYVWCKHVEAVVMVIASYVVFGLAMGLNYSLVLSVLVGLSVFLPFIGAIVVGVPIVGVAAVQFGPDALMIIVCLAYLVLQMIDGFVLSPWLFGQRLALSSFAVLSSILIFGAIMGIWGVLLSVPFLTFVQACRLSFKPCMARSDNG